MPIPIPDIDEQRKIGELLTCLDNLITLHQRQPFLQSPPDISLIVQLTPPFYTFSWEQRKLASLCEKFTDGDWIESKDQSDFGVRLVQTGNVGVAEYLDKTNNKNGYLRTLLIGSTAKKCYPVTSLFRDCLNQPAELVLCRF